MRRKMWNVTIRIKKNDELGGKRLEALLMDFFIKQGSVEQRFGQELTVLGNGQINP